jgi:acyl-CoA synthetase (AMP-forming)/AMP-acid ligase II
MAAEETLLDVLRTRAEDDPRRGQRFFEPRNDDFLSVSYAGLAGAAFAFAHRLAEQGVRERDYCLVCCRSLPAAVTAFYGAIARGAIPLLLALPRTLQGSRDAEERIAGLRAALGARAVLLLQAETAAEEDPAAAVPIPTVTVPDDPFSALSPEAAPPPSARVVPDDIAYLQGTSAATGKGKLVAITHRNVRAAVDGIRTGSRATPEETVVSWLPLYHDMGLVGCQLFALWHGYDLFLLSPFDFLKRPLRWLRTISRQRGTLSPAPDFGYSYSARLVSDHEASVLDLSSWRVACTGAEPVRLSTVKEFCRRFRASGFRPEALLPCYGLAEATLGVTFFDATAVPKYVHVRRIPAGLGGTVEILGAATMSDPSPQPASGAVSFSVGRPLPSLEVWLADEDGRRLEGEVRLGEVVVRGDSVSPGYLTGGRSLTSFADGLATGDLGFLFEGELYILDRLKNIIIRNGENHLASTLEEQVARRLGIPHEAVAVFESSILGVESEIVAVVESQPRTDLPAVLDRLAEAQLLADDVTIDRLLLTPVRTIPRTTSGKKRHFLCRNLLAQGALPVLREISFRSEQVRS